MTYSIFVNLTSEKILEKLDPTIEKRIRKKLRDMSELDHIVLEALVNEDEFKIRVGDYRIFFDLSQIHENIIFVINIDHRKKAYK